MTKATTKAQQAVIDVAKAEVGYFEKATEQNLDSKTANVGSANFTKYGYWFGYNGVPWCAIFVSWVFNQAGYKQLAPKYSSCYAGAEWFKKYATFHTAKGYEPKPGDVIFFSSSTYPNGGAHTGIVTAYDNGVVRTVEGNTGGGSTLIANGGCVAEKAYTTDYSPIYGYGTPNWPKEDPELTKAEVEKLIEAAKDEVISGIAKMLYGADTIPSAWAEKELDEAIQDRITDGSRPQGYATRQEVAIMCKRASDAANACRIDDGK